jgi:hypothetical protein
MLDSVVTGVGRGTRRRRRIYSMILKKFSKKVSRL